MLGLTKPRKWKLLGQIQPRALQFIRRPLKRSKLQETPVETGETTRNETHVKLSRIESHESC